jgi:hypothetical protein
VLATYTALALLIHTTICVFIAHWYIHSGPNTANAGSCASSLAAAAASFIMRGYTSNTTRHQSGKIQYNGVVAIFLGRWMHSIPNLQLVIQQLAVALLLFNNFTDPVDEEIGVDLCAFSFAWILELEQWSINYPFEVDDKL